MTEETTRRFGLIGAVGGLCQSLFLITSPGHTMAGAKIAQTSQWFLSHSLHFVGALLMLFGILSIYQRQRRAGGGFATFAMTIASTGNAMYIGTGMITAFVWPVLCRYDPALCAPDGPIFGFGDTFGQLMMATTATLTVGWILFGWSVVRAQVIPSTAGYLMIIGAIVFAILPPPLTDIPFIVSKTGGVLLGIGVSWAGFAVWTRVGQPAR